MSNKEIQIKQSLSFNCKSQYISKYAGKVLSKQYYIEQQRIFWGEDSELLSFDFVKNFKQNNMDDNLLNSISSFSSENAKASIKCRNLSEPIYKNEQKLNYRKKIKQNYFNLLCSRKSSRNFIDKKIDILDLGTILHYSCSINKNNKVGSGGGLYPVDIYFYANKIKNIEQGFYKYNKFSHSIHIINKSEIDLKNIFYIDNNKENLALALFYVVNQNINIYKYGDLSTMLSFWEAGSIAQNISLISEAILLGTCDYGGMVPHEIERFLKLDKYFNESIIGCTLIGRLE